MNCEHIEPLLTGYVLGDLDAKAQQDVASHLESCTRCEAQMEMIRDTVKDVRMVLTSQTGSDAKLDPKRRKKIIGARRRRTFEIPAILKVAAVLVVLLGWFGIMFAPALCSVRGKGQYCMITSNLEAPSPACDLAAEPPPSLDAVIPRALKDITLSDDFKPAAPACAPVPSEAAKSDVAASLDGDKEVSADGVGFDKVSDGKKRSLAERAQSRFGIGGSGVKDEVAAAVVKPTGMTGNRTLRGLVAGNTGGTQVPVVTDSFAEGEKTDRPQEVQVQKALGSFEGKYARDSSGPENARRSGLNYEVAVAKSPLVMNGSYAYQSEKAKKSLIADRQAQSVADSSWALRENKLEDGTVRGDRDEHRGSTVTKKAAEESLVAGDVVVTVDEPAVEGLQKQMAGKPVSPSVVNFSSVLSGSGSLVKTGAGTLTLSGGNTYSGATTISGGSVVINAGTLVPDATTAPVLNGSALSGMEQSTVLTYPAPVFNGLVDCANNPFSTFGIDVDTASFTLARRYLVGAQLPPPGAVRVEEFVNAFDYHYPSPDRRMFAVYTDRARSPFRPNLELLRIGVRGKVIGRDQQRPSVLTFVIDTSGSMNTPDRLPLVQKSLALLMEHLTPRDSVTLITFGTEPRLLLDSTPASRQDAILKAIKGLQTSGSTHLEGGMRLGYETAARHFQSGAINRVVLLSDGVANLGAATAGEILGQVESYRKQGIYCSVFGFGQGNYDDAMLQTLADKGDGVYRFVDSLAEARHVFVDDLSAMLHVIARDVKIQVEFDPARVKNYRQLGYEKRHLEKEQFRDNSVDAGEVGSGQSATALYELDVTGSTAEPLGTVRVRWNDVETGQFEEMAQPIRAADAYPAFDNAPIRFRLAAGLAEFAEKLRESPYASETTMDAVATVLRPIALELNLDRQVQDVVRMVETASKLKRK